MFLLLTYLIGALSLSFLCSILEAVLLSTPMSYISLKESEGAKNAKLLRKYKTDIDQPIAAILSLNTIAHTIGAAGVGAEATRVFGEASFGIVSAVMTLLILVFSEIIPKTIGATYWRTLTLPSTAVIHFLVFITYPLVKLSEGITKIFSGNDQPVSVSREEVSSMVEVASEEGVLKDQERKIIQNTIKLNNVPAEQIMTPNLVVFSVPETTTVKELFAKGNISFSRIPVYTDNRDYITGYVLKSVALELLANDKFNTPLSEIRRDILKFNEEDSAFNIWEKMLAKKEHISVIHDMYGCLRGIVTLEDIIETMLGQEIVDEADTVVDMQQVALEKYKSMQASNDKFGDDPEDANKQ